MAFDRLIENIVKMQNPTVAGLDPKLDYVHFLSSTRHLLTHFMILFLP